MVVPSAVAIRKRTASEGFGSSPVSSCQRYVFETFAASDSSEAERPFICRRAAIRFPTSARFGPVSFLGWFGMAHLLCDAVHYTELTP